MVSLFDTHCHLNAPELESRLDGLIEQAMQQGVNRWLIPATSPDQWAVIYQLSLKYPGIQAALGIHPWYVKKYALSSLNQITELVEQHTDVLVAIGETGLDHFKPHFEQQILYFETQLQLASRLKLPVIIHCVKAQDEVVRCLKEGRVSRGVIHGFTGSYQQAKQLIDLGMKIGVGGSITYPRASKTRDTISSLPLDTLVLETDAPAMPLSGFQGEPNVPHRLKMVFDVLVSLRAESKAQISDTLWENSQELFGSHSV